MEGFPADFHTNFREDFGEFGGDLGEIWGKIWGGGPERHYFSLKDAILYLKNAFTQNLFYTKIRVFVI